MGMFGRQPRPGTTSQAYGFALGASPLDSLATALEAGLRRIGVPTAAINDAVGLPSALQAQEARRAAFRELEAQGVRPGFPGYVLGSTLIGPLSLAALAVNPPPTRRVEPTR